MKILIFLCLLFFNSFIPNVNAQQATFPTTGIVDSANRANENPLSDGGKWTITAGNFAIVSDQIVGTNASNVNNAANFNALTLTANKGECYTTVSTAGTQQDDSLYIGFNSSNNSGYDVFYDTLGGVTDQLKIVRADSGTGHGLATYTQTITSGDGIGISAVNGLITVWYRSGSGGTWTALGSLTDNTYSVSGMNLGVLMYYNTTSIGFNYFGGGTQSSPSTINKATLNNATIN